MAKVKHPSYMPGSNGRTGDAVFYERKGVQCMRTYVVPVNPKTEKQRAHRGSFKDAVKAWQMLSSEEKMIYNKKAEDLKLSMSGYNLFLSGYIEQNKN